MRFRKPKSDPVPEGGVLRFRQRRLGRAVDLSVGARGIDYRYSYPSGGYSFHADHERVDPTVSTLTEKNANLQRLGWLLIVFGIAAVYGFAMFSPSGDMLALSVLLFVLGGFNLVLHHIDTVSFSVLRSDKGRILILHDGREKEILASIAARRVEILRVKYLHVDQGNNPRAEMAKYNWLRQMGAITEIEHAQFAAMLREGIEASSGKARPQPPTISLN